MSSIKPPVSLVSITPNAEQLIAYCARVSNPGNQENPDIAGLIKYCIKHQHWSIFEMSNMVVEVNTTRAVAAQILRHRSFSFQEFSQRYCDVSALGSGIDLPHLRRQDLKNRQNSVDDLDPKQMQGYYRRMAALFEDAEHLYQEMVSSGVAKECARNVLPLCAPTRLYMNGTIRSWIHYLQLRCDHGTQLEHQQIAREIKEEVFKKELPCVYEGVFG
jgi:thymidylate synthase (FAD)